MLPLHVSGRYVVAKDGCRRVKLSCINWAGAQLHKAVPAGLHLRTPDYLAAALADIGFNCVRVVYALQVLSISDVRPFWVGNNASSKDEWVNPKLHGLTATEVLDQVVLACVRAGLAVIINNHNSDLGWCCSDDDHNGLWWNRRFAGDAWLAHVQNFTQRYSAPEYHGMVIGFDLRNEVRSSEVAGRWHAAQWGHGSREDDWRRAAAEASEYVLRESEMLTIVEGIQYAAVLCMVAEMPLPAWMANRTLYSAHQYHWTQMGLFVPGMVLRSLSLPLTWWLAAMLLCNVAARRWRGRFGGSRHGVKVPVRALLAAGIALGLSSAALIGLRRCSLAWRIAPVVCAILAPTCLLSGLAFALYGRAASRPRRAGPGGRWLGRELRLRPDTDDGNELQCVLEDPLTHAEEASQPALPSRQGASLCELLAAFLLFAPVCLYLSSSMVLRLSSTRWGFGLEASSKWGRLLGGESPLPVWIGEYGPGIGADRSWQFQYFIEADMDLCYWQMAGEDGLRSNGTFKNDSYGIFGLDYNASNLRQSDSLMSSIRQTFVAHVTSVNCGKDG